MFDEHSFSKAGTFCSFERHYVKHSMNVSAVIFHFRILLASHNQIIVRIVLSECLIYPEIYPEVSAYLMSLSQQTHDHSQLQWVKWRLGLCDLTKAHMVSNEWRKPAQDPHKSSQNAVLLCSISHSFRWWRSHDQR